MTLETMILGLIAGFFIWRLYKAFDKKPQMPADRIRLVSKETGEVLEMQIVQAVPPKTKSGWNEESFLQAAKFAFQKVLGAFSVCDLKSLKQALDPSVYRVFEQDILARKTKKQKMDFTLICFDSAKILQKSPDNREVTVQFQTEQINLLKNEKGEIIEGDGMSVSVMSDTWVFRQIAKESWVVVATQSRAASCAK